MYFYMYENKESFFEKLSSKRVMFCGLGRSNLPVIEMLLNYGAKIIACDSRNISKLDDSIKNLEKRGVELRLGSTYMDNLDADIIFRTPGMSFFNEKLQEARKHGIVVTSEMEMFFDICPCPIIAVTGSDGKTTTTTIISEILKASKKTVHIGGNIGKPLLPVIDRIRNDDIAVVELSSFQLMSMNQSPNVAVVTNLSPNHLDIHKDMDEYINSKKNIILHQSAFDTAVLNYDNKITNEFSKSVRGKCMFFSRKQKVYNGVWCDENKIYFSKNGENTEILSISDIKLPGKHNLENYLAAICATLPFSDKNAITEVAKNFNGVEHRIEFTRNLNGVKYFNDSIASSPTRAISGTLSLFDGKIIMIAGGYDKKIPFDSLGPVVCSKVKCLILMGDTADKIENAVKKSHNYDEKEIKIIHVKNMSEAVKAAHDNTVCDDVVVLCPACASFGLYNNFEERGNDFKNIVNSL